MNDLKEIGGFIVSADPYVNHDNSLSGNGTLTSPLGVVPGYNETVLYENPSTGTQVTGGQTFTAKLSEQANNFERMAIVCIHSYGYGAFQNEGDRPVDYRVSYVKQDSNSVVWNHLDDLKLSVMNYGGNAPLYDANIATVSGDVFTCKGYGRYNLNSSGIAASLGQNNRGVAILKVIGINRKQ